MQAPVLPYIYILNHKTTGQFYIGYRFKNKVRAEFDLGIKYFSSSKMVKSRFDEFDFTILAEFFSAKDAYSQEQALIEENFKNPLILNKHYHKNGCNHFAQKYPHTEETKLKIGNASRNRLITDEWRNNQRLSHLGKKASEETKKKMSVTRKGKIKSAEHLMKIAKANRGRKKTPEAIENNRLAQCKKCTIDGIKIYSSLKELSNELGYGYNGSRSSNLKYL
jgi:hypothetical protein